MDFMPFVRVGVIVLAIVSIVVGLKVDKRYQRRYAISIWRGSFFIVLGIAAAAFGWLVPLGNTTVSLLLRIGGLAIIPVVGVYNITKLKDFAAGLKLTLVQLALCVGSAVMLLLAAGINNSSRSAKHHRDERYERN